MTKMTTKVKTQKSEKVWFFLGALAVFFMGVPYLVLGKDSGVRVSRSAGR